MLKFILPTFFLLSSLCAENISPLDRLIEGNKRFAHEKVIHPRRNVYVREATATKQEPFAIVLSCSDSRVPPEILFDQGVGDLFVVRVAGNVCGPLELDSIDYAALYLHSAIIFVLGHENCGAVTAVLQGSTKDIEAVAALIKPAIDESQSQEGNRLANAIKDNVKQVVNQLKTSPVISSLIAQGKIEVVGGYYNLKSGLVTLL